MQMVRDTQGNKKAFHEHVRRRKTKDGVGLVCKGTLDVMDSVKNTSIFTSVFTEIATVT